MRARDSYVVDTEKRYFPDPNGREIAIHPTATAGEFKVVAGAVVPEPGDYLIDGSDIYIVVHSGSSVVPATIRGLKLADTAKWNRVGGPTLPDGVPYPDNASDLWTWDVTSKRWAAGIRNRSFEPPLKNNGQIVDDEAVKADFFAYFGLSEHPKRQVVWRLAVDYSGDSYAEIMDFFGDVAEDLLDIGRNVA